MVVGVDDAWQDELPGGIDDEGVRRVAPSGGDHALHAPVFDANVHWAVPTLVDDRSVRDDCIPFHRFTSIRT